MRALAEDPERRTRIGADAAEHMRSLERSEATARGYGSAIEATLELIGDPVRTALARWAGALADIGVDDEPVLREGYGLSYAEAFEEFTRTP